MRYTLIPTVGIEFDGKKIDLGITPEELIRIMGAPEDGDIDDREPDVTKYYYHDSELRFDFDEDGKLEFIEFLGGIEGELRPEIYGADVFETNADELLELLTGKNGGDITDDDDGYSYTFIGTGIGITRSSTPEDIEDMIAESEEDGEEIDEEELEAEKLKAEHFETIGIGSSSYYDFLSEE